MVTSLTLVACGGARGKGQPMVADPAAASADDTGGEKLGEPGDADGGAVAATEADATGSGEKPATEAAPSGAAILQGNEEGARALLTQFVGPNADHVALTRSLRPTTNDYKTLFDAQTASKVEAGQAKEWNSNKAVIKPKAGQTEVKIWSATGADLAKGAGSAKEFPGGYKKMGKHLAPSMLFFRFKFVEPGKDTGTAYDGLAFVNGHWVIAPKPWRALEGKGGGMDEDTDAPAASTPAKPKPKGKGKGKKR